DQDRCSRCGLCAMICPYSAIKLDTDDRFTVNEVLCKGCGMCVSSCKSESITLRLYRNLALEEYIDGIFELNKTS
ncbi:MAG: 4Fe-4S binding protein, partial [Candidatus Helarchaeota archaeon]